MKVTGDHLKELERRCDLALASKTAREQIEIMGEYLNANIPSLPPILRTKFNRVLDVLCYKTVFGSAPQAD